MSHPSTAASSRAASPNRALPRIVCLHGSGTSAIIFKIQLRNLSRALRDHFRLIYLDAPYQSVAGPGVLPVFADCPPFWRWYPFEDYATNGVEAGVKEQERAARKSRQTIVAAIRKDDEDVRKDSGGKEPGPVVGVMGFSQGGRFTAGLLADQAEGRSWETQGMPEFKFGVMLCASYPPYSLTNASKSPLDFPGPRDEYGTQGPPSLQEIVHVPSVHVRGLQDPNLERGRRLSKYFAEHGIKEEKEYQMWHNLPQAAGDTTSGGQKSTDEIRDAILSVWDECEGRS
ncbi:uncharacterized protein KY384_007099 [Bacidia gigantensis]|uniref:uncharacterized protein n=1 Tax=Bacidia gigantensis TaxID=2732470 RepID=UPI001D043990|nr:uncharacterized protein KY384_007099 [Bacidia gigantensis]KAG8528182.1 hypothetical protein KY384_007099 [Bacidia gigantensis]